jgi:hypothetical protein
MGELERIEDQLRRGLEGGMRASIAGPAGPHLFRPPGAARRNGRLAEKPSTIARTARPVERTQPAAHGSKSAANSSLVRNRRARSTGKTILVSRCRGSSVLPIMWGQCFFPAPPFAQSPSEPLCPPGGLA